MRYGSHNNPWREQIRQAKCNGRDKAITKSWKLPRLWSRLLPMLQLLNPDSAIIISSAASKHKINRISEDCFNQHLKKNKKKKQKKKNSSIQLQMLHFKRWCYDHPKLQEIPSEPSAQAKNSILSKYLPIIKINTSIGWLVCKLSRRSFSQKKIPYWRTHTQKNNNKKTNRWC